MLISCDFDGVICQHKTIPSEPKIDNLKPVKNAREAIKWLQKRHTIYIQTNRDQSEVARWLDKWNFKGLVVTDKKLPQTSIYIDDRAIRFTNWQDICKYL